MPVFATVLKGLRHNLLMILILSGVLLGVVVGLIVRPYKPSRGLLAWLGLPGQLYLRMLKMMVVPLIIGSVTTGTASLGVRANGKVGVVSFLFIFFTNMSGALLGLIGFIIFKPGNERFTLQKSSFAATTIETEDIFLDLFRNVFPANLFQATFSQTQTKYDNEEVLGADNQTELIVRKYESSVGGANLLGLIFACTVLGIAAASLKEKGRLFLDFMQAATDTVIRVLTWFMWVTPVGVFSLILVSLAGLDDISGVFQDLGLFIGAVISSLLVQQFLVLPIILFALTRRNPYKHLLDIFKAWLICFSAASTAIAIPDMIYVCEEKLRLDRPVTRFVIPFSVTLSANGSAVFIACSCLFISNLGGVFPSLSTFVIVFLLATVTSLAIPSVPSSSIVTIVMILSSLGIPSEPIALLLTVDFLLDRVRTTNSCVSHTMCAAVTSHFCIRGDKIANVESMDVEISLMNGKEDVEMNHL